MCIHLNLETNEIDQTKIYWSQENQNYLTIDNLFWITHPTKKLGALSKRDWHFLVHNFPLNKTDQSVRGEGASEQSGAQGNLLLFP